VRLEAVKRIAPFLLSLFASDPEAEIRKSIHARQAEEKIVW
jgi:hypothetical protein